MSEELTEYLSKKIISKIVSELRGVGLFTASMDSSWAFYCVVAEVAGRISDDEIILTDQLTAPGTEFARFKLADPEVFEKIVKLVVEKRKQWERNER